MIAQNSMHNDVHTDSESKAIQMSTTQALNLDGSFAQMDASLGETQLNRSSAPAPLTAKENVSIDYKMVAKACEQMGWKLEHKDQVFFTI